MPADSSVPGGRRRGHEASAPGFDLGRVRCTAHGIACKRQLIYPAAFRKPLSLVAPRQAAPADPSCIANESRGALGLH